MCVCANAIIYVSVYTSIHSYVHMCASTIDIKTQYRVRGVWISAWQEPHLEGDGEDGRVALLVGESAVVAAELVLHALEGNEIGKLTTAKSRLMIS